MAHPGTLQHTCACHRIRSPRVFVPRSVFLAVSCISLLGVRQRSGEGVVRRNGCPKGCFWRVRFFSAPLRFALKTPENLKGAKKNGLSKNNLLDNRFSAQRRGVWRDHSVFVFPSCCPSFCPPCFALVVLTFVHCISEIAIDGLRCHLHHLSNVISD